MLKAVHIILDSVICLGQMYTVHGYLFCYVLKWNQIHQCYENIEI